MKRTLLLKTKDEKNDNIRFAVCEDGKAVFHGIYDKSKVYTGEFYSARITDRIPNMNANFCDAGLNQPGFISDIKASNGKIVLVQAENSAHDAKGTRFKTTLELACENIVLHVKGLTENIGLNVFVSRKITDSKLRSELESYVLNYHKSVDSDISDSIDIIVRTSAAELSDRSVLYDEITGAIKKWNSLKRKFKEEYEACAKVGLVSGFNNVLEYVFSHEHTSKFDAIITDSPILSHDLQIAYPELAKVISCTTQTNSYDIFAVYAVDGDIERSKNKTVYLKSGAFIVIEHTEALTVIDVNSGKNIKNDVLAINKEAACEILRQLRLRDIGGIIVCDFINFYNKDEQREFMQYFASKAQNDPGSVSVVGITKLGLVEITRKRT